MAWVYNSIHLIAQMLAIFVTYSNSYKVVRRDFESALFFNVVLLLLAAIIEGSLTQYQSAKRLFLWIIHFCFTASIIFVCCRLLYAPVPRLLEVWQKVFQILLITRHVIDT